MTAALGAWDCLRDSSVCDLLRVLAINEREDSGWVTLCQINEEWRLVVFKLDNPHCNMHIFLDYSIEEGHGWTDPCHFIFIVLYGTVIPSVGCPTRIPEWVDQRVQGLPDWNESGRIGRHQNGLLLAQEMRENRDDCRHGSRIEQNVEETITHVRQVVACIRALNLDPSVSDGFPHRCLNLENDFKDESLKQIWQPRRASLPAAVCLGLDVSDQLLNNLNVLVVVIVR